MGGFQLYSFFLCLIVFIALTGLFSFMIVYIGKQKATLISNGLEDAQIKEKVLQKLNKESTKTNKIIEIIKKVVSILLCVFLCKPKIILKHFYVRILEKWFFHTAYIPSYLNWYPQDLPILIF